MVTVSRNERQVSWYCSARLISASRNGQAKTGHLCVAAPLHDQGRQVAFRDQQTQHFVRGKHVKPVSQGRNPNQKTVRLRAIFKPGLGFQLLLEIMQAIRQPFFWLRAVCKGDNFSGRKGIALVTDAAQTGNANAASGVFKSPALAVATGMPAPAGSCHIVHTVIGAGQDGDIPVTDRANRGAAIRHAHCRLDKCPNAPCHSLKAFPLIGSFQDPVCKRRTVGHLFALRRENYLGLLQGLRKGILEHVVDQLHQGGLERQDLSRIRTSPPISGKTAATAA
jgi:hypothetical protein